MPTRIDNAPAARDDVDWSDRPRDASNGGIAWLRRGTGRPVLLLHGVGLRAESMAGLLDGLAPDHEVFAVDLPGHGDSALGDVGDTLTSYTDAIVSAMGPMRAPPVVVGHSMGAMIALDIAIRYADRCRAVIALNAVFRRSATAAEAVRRRALALSAATASDPLPTLSRWFGDDTNSAAALACRRWLETVDSRAYQSAYTVFSREDGPSTDGLSALACPALFVTGADEPNSTPAMSRTMAELSPRGRAVVVPDAAHMLPMTHASFTVSVIRDFLARDVEGTA